MQTSNRGLIEIAAHEGVCLRPYRDSVGVLTLGVGHTAAAGPPDPALFPTTEDQPIGAIFTIFRNDLTAVEATVNRLVKVPLSQSKFDALVSFEFNTGGLARSKLLGSLNIGDYPAAADGFMGWTKPPEIIGRRKKEQSLFRDGVYSSNGKVNVFPVNARQQPVYSQGRETDVMQYLGRDQSPILPEPAIPPPRPRPMPPDYEPPTSPPFGGLFDALVAFIRSLFKR